MPPTKTPSATAANTGTPKPPPTTSAPGTTPRRSRQSSKRELTRLIDQANANKSAIAAPGAPNPEDDDLKFESNTKSAKKLEREMRERGWTESSVRETVRNPYTTRVSLNKANGHPATAYYTKDGAYVVVDDITNEVLQVSDRFLPMEWIPDSSIINPYIPFS